KDYGGLEYYARFFRLIKGVNLENNVMLCYYLSLAANKSLFDRFNMWGFNLPDIYAYQSLLISVEKAISSISPMNPFLQPFKKISELFYWAVVSGIAPPDKTRLFLSTALFIARNVRLIALITYSILLLITILILILKFRREIIEATNV
ncbi:MAG: hypothetical protein QXT84_06890, partial [Candidatus Bathyarchaeia archaeon]